MNSQSSTDNASPNAHWVAQKTKSVKSFVLGDFAKPVLLAGSFTSPILKPNRKHLIDDVVEDKKPSKRRKRNPWSKQEDVRLLELVQLADLEDEPTDATAGWDFGEIARDLSTGRTAKQCRDRWKNYLRGGIKKGGWTDDEEELIKDMFTTFGPKWTAMAKLLEDRTDNDIKNKWYSMKRKDERTGLHEAVNAFSGVRDVAEDVTYYLAAENADGHFQQRNWGRKKCG